MGYSWALLDSSGSALGVFGVSLQVLFWIIVIAPRVPPTLFRMFSVSLELHWVSISLALLLSLLRRARVEPLGISEDLAKQ